MSSTTTVNQQLTSLPLNNEVNSQALRPCERPRVLCTPVAQMMQHEIKTNAALQSSSAKQQFFITQLFFFFSCQHTIYTEEDRFASLPFTISQPKHRNPEECSKQTQNWRILIVALCHHLHIMLKIIYATHHFNCAMIDEAPINVCMNRVKTFYLFACHLFIFHNHSDE